jgi:hypothetical protein
MLKRKPRWTADECRVLVKHVAQIPKKWEAIQKEIAKSGYVRTIEAIKSKLGKLAVSPSTAPPLTTSPETKVEWPDKKHSEVNWRDNLEAAASAVDRHHKASASQDVATIKINTTTPIAVCYSSDWHLGSICSDHRTLKKHIEYIIGTKDLYMISNGDETDNMQIFRNVSARAQSLPISEQAKTFAAMYHELCDNSKLLCAGYGNHSEEFEERNVGFSYTAMIKGSRVPYFRGIGKLFLQIGSGKKQQEYIHIMSHDGKGNSATNPLHGPQRQAMIYEPLADVSVASHTHNPAFAYSFGHGLEDGRRFGVTFPLQPRIDIRTGTFKTGDPFSQRYFGQGRIGIPTVVFHPDRKEMIPFATPEHAISYIRGIK